MTTIKMNTVTNYSLEISKLIRSSLTPKMMQEKIAKYHENDIAIAMESLNQAERLKLYQILDAEVLADILEYSDHINTYIAELSLRKRVDVFSNLETQKIINILNQLDKKEKEAIIDILNPQIRKEVQLISSFDEALIGSVMSFNYIAINDHLSTKQAKQELIKQASKNDNINTIYVLDEEGIFYGAIDLKDLLVALDDTALKDLMTCSYPYVYADVKIDDCMPQLIDYSEDSIPVLSADNKMIGVITVNELMELFGEEMNEDYVKLGGLSALEDLEEPIILSIKKRLPWLFILLAMGLGVSFTVGLFEAIVAQLPIIMCFQSLILDMSGNVGTQSLAVAIRVLMDKKISTKEKIRLIFKEGRVGFSNGLILGILSFIVIGLYLMIIGNELSFSFAVSGCLGISMIISMFISSLSGTIIPVLFQKIGIDPAVASGPLITTVNDLVAVISYYGLSWIILINILSLA